MVQSSAGKAGGQWWGCEEEKLFVKEDAEVQMAEQEGA